MGEEGIRREGKGMGKGKGKGEGEGNGREWRMREGDGGKGWGMRDVGRGSQMGIGGNRANPNPSRWKGKSDGWF